MCKPIQVFEHTALAVGGHFTEAHFRRLVQYNERHGNRYFTVGYNRIHFQSYVGVIQVGDLTIEILPKADNKSACEADKGKWQAVLIDMIRQSGFVKLASLSDARLRTHSASLLDIFFESFLAEVEQLTHKGLVRKYRQNRGNVTALKGRLIFQQQIARNLVHRERFYTEHVNYDRDNPFNQVLGVALDVLARVSRNPHLVATSRNLSLSFQEIASITVTENTFTRLCYTRNTERYRRAIQLAKLIILNYSPDIRSGREDVLAILFDMNMLFERYVFVQLKRAEVRDRGHDISFRAQTSRRYWQSDSLRKYIRPDIIATIRMGETEEYVILDTKWKLPADGKPADADLHQMHTYNVQFGAHRSVLLYPQVDALPDLEGTFAESHFIRRTSSLSCGLMFLELFDGARLRHDLGEYVIARIMARVQDTAVMSDA